MTRLNSKKTKTNKKQKQTKNKNKQKLLELRTLEIALKFRDLNEIYFPVRLDFRGRVYPVVDYLNYQGTDLAKSLLIFSNGEKVYKSDIESINYLFIYGAICYGNGLNRKPTEEKISWVEKNKEDIIIFKNKK